VDVNTHSLMLFQVLGLVLGSGATATTTAVGLILLLLAGVLAYGGLDSNPEEDLQVLERALFLCLIFGVIFVGAGRPCPILRFSKLDLAATQHSTKYSMT